MSKTTETIEDNKIEVIDPVKTGLFIKKIRLDLGMTQKELASKLFLTRKAVSKWETGNSCPSLDVLKRLAVILHASIEEICEGEFRDKSKNVDNSTPIRKIINSKIFKISVLICIILLVAGIFISHNDKRTTVYSINTLSDDFYLKNASIVKSGDTEIINLGNFQCDLKDVSEDTIFDFHFFIKTKDGEKELFKYSYTVEDGHSLISNRQILSKIQHLNKTNLYLRISYYNDKNEYKEYETKIIIKKLKTYGKDYDFSKYTGLGGIEEAVTIPAVNFDDKYTIDVSFLFEMSEEELLQRFPVKTYNMGNLEYEVKYQSDQFYVASTNMRFSINKKAKLVLYRSYEKGMYLKIIENKVDLSSLSDNDKNDIKRIFEIIY